MSELDKTIEELDGKFLPIKETHWTSPKKGAAKGINGKEVKFKTLIGAGEETMIFNSTATGDKMKHNRRQTKGSMMLIQKPQSRTLP